MPTLVIDGRELPFEPGQTVIQVAHAHGIDVPHYCYHPGLSIAGNCRICLVEVEGWPRPQISCKLAAAPGLVVFTQSEKARQARAGTMEFLLVNHPLDCPICDQAGECHLQDYSYELGQGASRSATPKTKLPKNVPFGARIVYDAERCIKCTLCVRFCEEVTGTGELAMAGRSDHEIVVMTRQGEFTTRYSMNVVDLCPVGALTSRDFRFKSRLWFMDFAETVCTSCARGCNVTTGAREGALLRLEPRPNPDVNRWWMCDPGRLDYAFVNSPTRLKAPRVKGADGAWREVPWDDAIVAAARALAAHPGDVLLDANLTLEEMALAADLAACLGGRARYAAAVGDDADDFLIVNEKGANAEGARRLGLTREALPDGGGAGPAPASLLLVERDRNVPAALRAATGARVVFAADAAHVPPSAEVVFPLGTFAEREGVLLNHAGRPQWLRRNPGAGPLGLVPAVEVLEELLLEVDPAYRWRGAAALRAELAARPGLDGLAALAAPGTAARAAEVGA